MPQIVLRSRTLSLVLAGSLLWVTACYSYRLIDMSELSNHGEIRVTLTDGKRTQISDPRVVEGSVEGKLTSAATATIPVDSVAKVEAKSVNVPATIGLSLIVALALGTALFFAVCERDCSGYSICC